VFFQQTKALMKSGASQPGFLRRAPENRPRAACLVEALAVLGGEDIKGKRCYVAILPNRYGMWFSVLKHQTA